MPKTRVYNPLERYVVAPSGCWIWQGGTAGSKARYGVTWLGSRTTGSRRMVYAHRLFYEEFVGPIPDGLTIDHLCRQPMCVNPSHLEPVTMRVNILRSASVSAQNARKVLCPQGHPLDGKRSSGSRYCKQCHREAEARRRAAAPTSAPKPLKTHCVNGHLFDEENTYLRADGGRNCRACGRENAARKYASR